MPDLDSQSPLHLALVGGDYLRTSALLKSEIAKGLFAPEIRDWFVLFHGIYCLSECQFLALALSKAPDRSPSDLLTCARLFFKSGRYELAAGLTEEASRLDPANADILAMLASARERSGQPLLARSHLASALEIDPAHARAARLLAHLDRLDGQLEQARSRLEDHLAHHPSSEDWRLRYELASVLDRQKKHCEAMAVLLEAKRQLAPSVPFTEAAHLATRQWEVTQRLTVSRLESWRKISAQLTPLQPLCLLAGFPRSGTTLLEKILTNHPGVIGTDESGILNTNYERLLILEAHEAAEALAELDDFLPEELSTGRADFLRCTAEHIGERLKNRLLIEKDPLLTTSFAVPLRLFPDAKIIMPLRDPRDVVISYFFTIVPLVANSSAALDLGRTCQFYAKCLRHWLLLKERLPVSQWLESRYEDLLADPESQTRKLAAFLEIPWSETMLAHHRNSQSKPVTTPTYHDVSRPLYRSAVGRWKNHEAALAPHLHHLEPYLRAFGYR